MDFEQQPVEIEFLYLDLTSCGPCVASDASLREAVTLLRPVLEPLGVLLNVGSTHVTSALQAQTLRLVSSPTIRVDGSDIADGLIETPCGDCTGLSADAGPVACRVWHWRGKQYADAPVGLIIDAVPRRVYVSASGLPTHPEYDVLPDNLAQFFGASNDQGTT